MEGDTIVGRHHESAVIILVEKVSKLIITIRPEGGKAGDIEKSIDSMFSTLVAHLFKSITFDFGKEFSKWNSTCNQLNVSIFFADPRTPRNEILMKIQKEYLEEVA